MLNEQKKSVTRAKALYGFMRIVPYARWWIKGNTYLSGAERERLLKKLDELVGAMDEARRRAAGQVTELPQDRKVREKRAAAQKEKLDKMMG